MNNEITILNFALLTKVTFIAFCISIIISFIPEMSLSKFKAVEVLKGNITRSKKGVFARNMMLDLQFLISGFFLT